MFIVFEGIDGSGKTTLSGRVAEILIKEGLTVHQARPKGELKSRLAQDIRTLARDPRNLTMSAHTEMFLFIARDTQTIDTVIRPQLEEAEVVIADRYLYSAQVLCRARGIVPRNEIDTAVEVAARGLWPDLVIYCDVDIDTSALRKNIDKIVNPREPEDFGRKGLRGLGLRDAMRDVYLDMAAQNPDKWFVVDNAHAGIEENAFKIANRILTVANKTTVKAPAVEHKHEALLVSDSLNPETLRADFYDYIKRLINAGRVAEAAYHLRSMDSEEAWQLRESIVDKAPALTAYGLAPLFSKRALEIRRKLIDIVPLNVAKSLSSEWADTNDEAWAIRKQLAKTVPDAVASTLGTLDDEKAWEMRDMLVEDAGISILSSLKGLDCDRAWKMRDKYGKKKNLPGLLKGLGLLDNERAWELRDKHKKNGLPWFILSLVGIESDNAWKLRREYLENATKLTVRSMTGSTDPRAWEMRREAAPYAREALTTIKGIDSPEAWKLRSDFLNRWAGAACKSVGMTLARTDAGYEFLLNAITKYPSDPDVLHYVVKAIELRQGDRT